MRVFLAKRLNKYETITMAANAIRIEGVLIKWFTKEKYKQNMPLLLGSGMLKEIFPGLSREKRRVGGDLALHHFHFAQSKAVGGNFYELIALNVLQCLLEAQLHGWGDTHFIIRSGSPDVGEFLALGQVDG